MVCKAQPLIVTLITPHIRWHTRSWRESLQEISARYEQAGGKRIVENRFDKY